MKTNGAGAYQTVCHQLIAHADSVGGEPDLADIAKRDWLGLGVAIFVRNPLALHSARKHAMHSAMAAHARGCAELGAQLERLGGLLSGLLWRASKGEATWY